jgi:hypothetical protein
LAVDPELTDPVNVLLRDAAAERFGDDMDPIPA